jgi:hypothetical protein
MLTTHLLLVPGCEWVGAISLPPLFAALVYYWVTFTFIFTIRVLHYSVPVSQRTTGFIFYSSTCHVVLVQFNGRVNIRADTRPDGKILNGLIDMASVEDD